MTIENSASPGRFTQNEMRQFVRETNERRACQGKPPAKPPSRSAPTSKALAEVRDTAARLGV